MKSQFNTEMSEDLQVLVYKFKGDKVIVCLYDFENVKHRIKKHVKACAGADPPLRHQGQN